MKFTHRGIDINVGDDGHFYAYAGGRNLKASSLAAVKKVINKSMNEGFTAIPCLLWEHGKIHNAKATNIKPGGIGTRARFTIVPDPNTGLFTRQLFSCIPDTPRNREIIVEIEEDRKVFDKLKRQHQEKYNALMHELIIIEADDYKV